MLNVAGPALWNFDLFFMKGNFKKAFVKSNFQVFSNIFNNITPQDTKLYSCVSCEYKTPQKDKIRSAYKGYPLENKRFAVSKMWIQNCNQGSITTSHYFNLWQNQKVSLRTMWSSSISNSKSNQTIQRCP